MFFSSQPGDVLKKALFVAIVILSGTFYAAAPDPEVLRPGVVHPLVPNGDSLWLWIGPETRAKAQYEMASTDEGIELTATPQHPAITAFSTIGVMSHAESQYRVTGEARVENAESARVFGSGEGQQTLAGNGGIQQFDFILRQPPRQQNAATSTRLLDVKVSLKGAGGKLVVRRLSMKPVPEPDKMGLGRITLSGVPCQGIVISTDAADKGHFDLKAAHNLRNYLFDISGEILPIELYAGGPAAPDKIYLGHAAQLAGFTAKPGIGGYALEFNAKRSGITSGDGPGTISGVWALLKKLGVKYYAFDDIAIPSESKLDISGLQEMRTPDIAYRGYSAIWFFQAQTRVPFGFTDLDILGESGLATLPGWSEMHTSNALCNFDLYSKEHPEYFALQRDTGKRLERIPGKRFCVHLCMSNPEVQDVVAENLRQWMRVQPYAKFFYVSPGDAPATGNCVCSNCMALETGDSFNERQNYFNSIILQKTAKEFPDKIILNHAYTPLQEAPPVKFTIHPRSVAMYCLYPPNWDCGLHSNCNANLAGNKTLNQWFQRGLNKNLSFFTYPSAINDGAYMLYCPLDGDIEMIRLAVQKGVSQFNTCGVPRCFTYIYNRVTSAVLWDADCDVEQELKEAFAEYFASASQPMAAFFELMRDVARSRKLHQNYSQNMGMATEEFVRQAYPLFEQAEKAAGDDSQLMRRIEREKICLLYNDILENNLNNGNAEMNPDAFSLKIAEFAKLCRKFRISHLGPRFSGAQFISMATGLKITNSTWYNDENLAPILANPGQGSLLLKEERTQKEIPGGWILPLDRWKGGDPPAPSRYNGSPRSAAKVLRRQIVGRNYRFRYVFFLDSPPAESYVLDMEGLDDEKPSRAHFSITVNGHEVFNGPNTFDEQDWSRMQVEIPGKYLKTGSNKIQILNTTPEGLTGEEIQEVRDGLRKISPYWGWILFAEFKLLEKR